MNRSAANPHRVHTNKWLKARETTTLSDDNGHKYKSGFHIYMDRPAQTTESIIVPVLATDVTTFGREDGNRIMIARKMFVPEAYVRKVNE